MDLIAIAAKLDTILGAVSGIVEHYPQVPDTIGNTPCLIVGQPKGVTMPGVGLQITTFSVPLTILVGRIPDDARTRALLNPLVQGVIAALAPINEATGAALLWTVVSSIDWDTDRKADFGGEAYLAIDFLLHMELHESVGTYGAI